MKLIDRLSHNTMENSDILIEIEVLLCLLGFTEANPFPNGPRWILINPTPLKKIMADAILSVDGPDELASIINDTKQSRNPWLAFRQYLSDAALQQILIMLRCQYAQNQCDQVG